MDEAVAAKAQELAGNDAPLDKIEVAAPADAQPSAPVTAPESATEPAVAGAEVPGEAGQAPPAAEVPSAVEADPSVPAADSAAEPTPAPEEVKEDETATETPAQVPTPATESEPQAAEPPVAEPPVAEPQATEPEAEQAVAGGEEAAAGGTKRPAEDAAPAEAEAPPAKAAKFEIDPEDPNAEYFTQIVQIPAGQTRTFSDIAVGAGAKPSAARSIGRTVAKISIDELGLPWWRVVSSIGALQSNPARQEAQLTRLRAEGARPEEGEVPEVSACCGVWGIPGGG